MSDYYNFRANEIQIGETTLRNLKYNEKCVSAEVASMLEKVLPANCMSNEDLRKHHKLQICSVHEVVNTYRTKMWALSEEHWTGLGYQKQVLLHGTKVDSLGTIFGFGFNPSFSQNTLIGKGVYFSPLLRKSVDYGSCVIVCEAFFGKMGSGQEDVPPAALGYHTTMSEDGRIVCIGDPGTQIHAIGLVRLELGFPKDF